MSKKIDQGSSGAAAGVDGDFWHGARTQDQVESYLVEFRMSVREDSGIADLIAALERLDEVATVIRTRLVKLGADAAHEKLKTILPKPSANDQSKRNTLVWGLGGRNICLFFEVRMSEWTKGPWVASSYRVESLEGGDGQRVAVAYGETYSQSEANAARIVQCVNGFDALVEALQLIVDECDSIGTIHVGGGKYTDVRDFARDVLQKKTSSNLLPPSTSNPEGK